MCALQNRGLLDAMHFQQSNSNAGHILLYTTLIGAIGLDSGIHNILVTCASPHSRLCRKKLWQSNRQDMAFIHPPGISDGAILLRMRNIRFCNCVTDCKLLLLFKIHSKIDAGMKELECAYVSVPEEYNGAERAKKIRSYFAYDAYFAYITYWCFDLISFCHSMGG